MLYVTYKFPYEYGCVMSIRSFFSDRYKKEWFLDDMVQDFIKTIDGNDVYVVNNIPFVTHPIIGAILPSELSGGTQGLISMLKYHKNDKKIFYKSSFFGNNCFPWIMKMSEMIDIYLFINSSARVYYGKYAYDDYLIEKYGDYKTVQMFNLDDNILIKGDYPKFRNINNDFIFGVEKALRDANRM